MKSNLLLMLVILFTVMISCVNDPDPGFSEESSSGSPIVVTGGKIVFSFVVPESVNGVGRSAEDSGSTEVGTENESKIDKARVYLFNSETKNLIKSFDIQVDNTSKNNGMSTYTGSNKISVEPGSYDVFAIANYEGETISGGSVNEFLKNVDKKSYPDGIADASKPLIMTNRGVSCLNILVAKPDTEDVVTTVSIELERVVAKLKLAKNKDVYTLEDTNSNPYAYVNLGSFRYFNLGRSFYTYRHVATLADGKDDVNLVQPEFVCTNNFFGDIPAKDGYVIDPYFFKKTVADGDNFTNPDGFYAQPFSENNPENINSLMNPAGSYTTTYCLENCMYRPAQKRNYVTGIVFKASITIPANRTFDENGNTIDPSNLPGVYYFNYNFYVSLKAVHDIGKANVPTDGTPLTPELEKKYGIKYLVKSLEGSYHCYYNFFIRHLDNNDNSTMGVMEYGIVRNNIYQVLITNVKGLGNGTPDVKPGDIETEAYLTVNFSVSQWGVRHQEGELE